MELDKVEKAATKVLAFSPRVHFVKLLCEKLGRNAMLSTLEAALREADELYTKHEFDSSYYTCLWTAVHTQDAQTEDDRQRFADCYMELIHRLARRGHGEGVSLKLQQFGSFEHLRMRSTVGDLLIAAANKKVPCMVSALQAQYTRSEFALFIESVNKCTTAGHDTRLLGYCVQMDQDRATAEGHIAQILRGRSSIRLVKGGWFRDANHNRYSWRDVTERYAAWAVVLAVHGLTHGFPHVLATHDLGVAHYVATKLDHLVCIGWKVGTDHDKAHEPCFACFGMSECRRAARHFPTCLLKQRVGIYYGRSSRWHIVKDSVVTLDMGKQLRRRCSCSRGTQLRVSVVDALVEELIACVLEGSSDPAFALLRRVL